MRLDAPDAHFVVADVLPPVNGYLLRKNVLDEALVSRVDLLLRRRQLGVIRKFLNGFQLGRGEGFAVGGEGAVFLVLLQDSESHKDMGSTLPMSEQVLEERRKVGALCGKEDGGIDERGVRHAGCKMEGGEEKLFFKGEWNEK